MVRYLSFTPHLKSKFKKFLIINSNNNFNYTIDAEMKLIINSSWLEKNYRQFSSTFFPFIPYFSKFPSKPSQIISTVFHFPLYNLNHSYLPTEKANGEKLHHTTFNYLKETHRPQKMTPTIFTLGAQRNATKEETTITSKLKICSTTKQH
jgi:hypothetical protein